MVEQSSIIDTQIVFAIGIFKSNLLKCLHFPSRNYLFYIGDRPASIHHTHLILNFSALIYHLFQKNCYATPACALCDAPVEDAKHYFLFCPSFAALREKLFAYAAQLLGNRWHCASDMKNVDWFFNGIPMLIFKLMLGCFNICPIVYFFVQPFLLTILCLFFSSLLLCSIVACNCIPF